MERKSVVMDPTEYNLQAFYNQMRFVANLAESLEKKTYYHNLLHDNQHDYMIFKLTNQFLFRNIMPPLPPSNSDLLLAMDFNGFFCDKINQNNSWTKHLNSEGKNQQYWRWLWDWA